MLDDVRGKQKSLVIFQAQEEESGCFLLRTCECVYALNGFERIGR